MKNMNNHQLLKPAVLVAVLLLSGCVSTTPHWDAAFGNTVNMAKAQQTINPDASRNVSAVNGIDGRSAQLAVERYHNSFKQPETKTNPFVIGVSGSENN